jgi:hypothetical protein
MQAIADHEAQIDHPISALDFLFFDHFESPTRHKVETKKKKKKGERLILK